MSQPTVLQINSLEALERLIGGDSALEIDIRNSVVQKFAEKHLKPIARSLEPYVADLKEAGMRAIKDHCSTVFGVATSNGYSATTVKLNKATQDALTLAARAQVNTVIDDAIRAALNGYDGKINEVIEARINRGLTDVVNARVDAKLKALAATLHA